MFTKKDQKKKSPLKNIRIAAGVKATLIRSMFGNFGSEDCKEGSSAFDGKSECPSVWRLEASRAARTGSWQVSGPINGGWVAGEGKPGSLAPPCGYEGKAERLTQILNIFEHLNQTLCLY